MNIIAAIKDPNLFRPFLGDDLSTWAPWFAALRVLYGLKLDKGDRQIMRQCTNRDPKLLPKTGFDTALFLTGRRSGKSRTAALVGAFEAVLAGREAGLAKGEKGVVLICSPTKSQSRIVRDYVRAIFETPLLANEVETESKEGFELKSGTRIEILAGDWRTVRGFTLLCAVIDELAFFGYDSESKVKSDSELMRAIKPSLATCGGKLIGISSPYAMKGYCYTQWKRHFGKDSSNVLVWNCPSRTMNPTLPQSIVDQALEEDLASAKAEYLGEFRDDIATFLPRDVIESLVVKGRQELSFRQGIRYSAFIDISGGRVDDSAMAIAHRDDNKKVIIDFVRRWRPPFSPDLVIGEMVDELLAYRISRCVGDNYSAEFVKSGFESRGIKYARCSSNPWSSNPTAKVAKAKSQLYLELLPRLCSGEIELLDDPILINQLAGLERRTRSGGRDIIDHGPGQHDDVANVVAGVCDCVVQKRIVAGVVSLDGADDGRTTFQSAMRDFEARQLEFDAEQRWLAQPDPDPFHGAEIFRTPNPF